MHDPVLVTNPARPREHGSGFPIRPGRGGGLVVVTCAHVVHALGATGILVAGRPATLVIDLADQGIDLAVLSVPDLEEQVPFELGRGAEGEEVELLGFEPAGGGPLSVPRRGRLVDSSLTALKGINRPAWQLVLDNGEIQGGHSGGPVISLRTGKVAGVIAMGPAQQGGRDGVAVAIENLARWVDAPTIAPARPPTDPEPGASTPGARPRSHRGRWLLIGGGSLVAAAAVAALAWPREPAAPRGCVLPDLSTSYEAFAPASWCLKAAGQTACTQRYLDGSVVTGTCEGTVAAGTWIARDARGLERWRATFAAPGQRPTAIFERRTTEPSGALHTVRDTRGAAVAGDPGKFIDQRFEEWRCPRTVSGRPDATVSRDTQDLVEGEVEVALSVAGSVLRCTLRGGVAASCAIGLRQVTGALAGDAYRKLLDAEAAIQNCQDATLPPIPGCGDGELNADEECDTGGATGACDADCTTPKCGDGVVNTFAGEACEPGLRGENPLCNKNCTVPRCGDGVLNLSAGEVCEPTVASGTATCDADCTKPQCGDGVLNRTAREQCDVGRVDTATCNAATCTTARCGDGIVNAAAGEACDTRGIRTRTCTADCKLQPGVLRTTPGAGSGR